MFNKTQKQLENLAKYLVGGIGLIECSERSQEIQITAGIVTFSVDHKEGLLPWMLRRIEDVGVAVNRNSNEIAELKKTVIKNAVEKEAVKIPQGFIQQVGSAMGLIPAVQRAQHLQLSMITELQEDNRQLMKALMESNNKIANLESAFGKFMQVAEQADLTLATKVDNINSRVARDIEATTVVFSRLDELANRISSDIQDTQNVNARIGSIDSSYASAVSQLHSRIQALESSNASDIRNTEEIDETIDELRDEDFKLRNQMNLAIASLHNRLHALETPTKKAKK